VAVPYLIAGVFALHLHSPAAFRRWMGEYSELGWWWDFHVLLNLRLDLGAFRHAVAADLPGQAGLFHLGHRAPAGLRRLYVLTLLGGAGAAYAFFAALPLLWRSHNRPVVIVCAVWMAVYAAFFTVWSPGYFVFWVPVLVPAGVMLALALAHRRSGRGGVAAPWLLGAWIALYAALNALAGIGPRLRPGSDPFRRIAADVRAHTRPGDLVLVAGAGDGGPCEVALPYFADREVVSIHGSLTAAERARRTTADALASAQERMDAALAAGHAVYALDEIIPAPRNARTLAALSKHHRVTAADLKTLLFPYTRASAWHSPRGPVWRLTPLPPPPAPAPADTPTAVPEAAP
jgi:hypothetical protein